jgi:hypothetical protein
MIVGLVLVTALGVDAQTTSFTYQGQLQDGGSPANGSYDLQFGLFDALTNGNQAASTLIIQDVTVTSGIFSVSLDFGQAFPGASRWLEIAVRPGASTGSFTTLSPRQPITSTPYAITSLNASSAVIATNATQLGGVAANQYVLTTDSRLSNARPPTAGSTDYIQNTTSPQAANFNISGNGTVGGSLGVGGFLSAGNSLFSTNGNNGVRITPASDGNIGVLNVTNAANSINWLTVGPNGRVIMNGGLVGIGKTNPQNPLDVSGEISADYFKASGYAFGGGDTACWLPGNGFQLGGCGSSLRYKTHLNSFAGGFDILNRLHPITFNWKENGKRDLGLAAEDVEQVEPLLVVHNQQGEVEGVKYDRLTVVLINAVKQQQEQIERQRRQIDEMRQLICVDHAQADLCK